MTEQMLPPPPSDTERDLPRLVEFDDDAPLWRSIEETAVETWRPTGHE